MNSAPSSTVKPQVKPNKSKQVAGPVFGTPYLLKNWLTLTILSAKYHLSAADGVEPLVATPTRKLVTLQIAVKNSGTIPLTFDPANLFTLFDAKGQSFDETGLVSLASAVGKAPDLTLLPGKSLGMPAQKDPLTITFGLPISSRLVKLRVNMMRDSSAGGRNFTYVLGAAGRGNSVSPLSPEVVAKGDLYGAIPTFPGRGMVGTFYPSGLFDLRFDGQSTPVDPTLDGIANEDGKKYVVVTFTATNRTSKELNEFDLTGGEDPWLELIDTDNETYKPVAFRKGKLDEVLLHTFAKDEPYTVRAYFSVPMEAKAKRVILAAPSSPSWAFDL